MKEKRSVLKVYLNPGEMPVVAASARAARMSKSAFARSLVLGGTPVSDIDLDHMEKMAQVSADLGRLGGLLKMLLTNDERLNDIDRNMALVTIDGVLMDIRTTKANLAEIVKTILRRAKRG